MKTDRPATIAGVTGGGFWASAFVEPTVRTAPNRTRIRRIEDLRGLVNSEFDTTNRLRVGWGFGHRSVCALLTYFPPSRFWRPAPVPAPVLPPRPKATPI